MQDWVSGAGALSAVWSRMSVPITLIAVVVIPIMIGVFDVLEDYGRPDAAAVAFGVVLSSMFAAHVGHHQPNLRSATGDVVVHLIGVGFGGMFVGIPVMLLGMIGGWIVEVALGEGEARLVGTIAAGGLSLIIYVVTVAVIGTRPVHRSGDHEVA